MMARAIAIRRGKYGEDGGSRVADAMFHLAVKLKGGGELFLDAKLLNEIVYMSRGG